MAFRYRRPRLDRRAAAALCGAAALACTGGALAEPAGGVITSGGRSVNIQSPPRTTIEWTSFSISSKTSTNFKQPGASAFKLNSVISRMPSQIRGVPGNSYLGGKTSLKPMALIYPSPANINTLEEPDAVSQTEDEARFSVSGVITANLRQIQYRSARAHALDLRGDGLITFAVDASGMANIAGDGEKLGIDNSAALHARSGQVMLTAATVSKAVNSVINLGGVIDADAFAASESGGMVLVASPSERRSPSVARAGGR